eukprot:CAMPEP_0117501924 /NCGR_PEP_ID=MMETSP0784-20121206/23551_1 /TAXON_ID=39447 /ORGANISM="" /LENGTH=71 /DNA_ID=CAMNT_0005297197 /DNA_START=608 /DNA_END=823 /DNA_ORIENTATION=-
MPTSWSLEPVHGNASSQVSMTGVSSFDRSSLLFGCLCVVGASGIDGSDWTEAPLLLDVLLLELVNESRAKV